MLAEVNFETKRKPAIHQWSTMVYAMMFVAAKKSVTLMELTEMNFETKRKPAIHQWSTIMYAMMFVTVKSVTLMELTEVDIETKRKPAIHQWSAMVYAMMFVAVKKSATMMELTEVMIQLKKILHRSMFWEMLTRIVPHEQELWKTHIEVWPEPWRHFGESTQLSSF